MKKVFILLFMMFVFTPFVLKAQDSTQPTCFDYYKLGSVNANISSQSKSAVAGMSMNFWGDISNKNSYPITGGSLYVKVLRENKKDNSSGGDVVDQFIAIDDIEIPAGGSVPVSFVWKIPTNAQTGNYKLVTYFVSDKRFNLLGSPSSDFLTGNTFDFSVNGEQTGVTLNKNSIKLNKAEYSFYGHNAPIKAQDDAKISIFVDNTTKQGQAVEINWSLYKQDNLDPKNLVRTFKTSVQLNANSSKQVDLTIPEKDDPIYYLVGELKYKDSKSIVEIQFRRDGVDSARIIYPSITSFPINKGEQNAFFACLNNIGTSDQIGNSKVVLEVKDSKGKIIDSYTYNGNITKDVMILKKDFTSKYNIGVFSLHTSIFKNDKLVDESVVNYDCKNIDPSKCVDDNSGFITLLIVIVLLVILATLFVLWLFKNKKTTVLPLILFFVVSLAIPMVSGATTISQNMHIGGDLKYNRPNADGSSDGWGNAIQRLNIQVKYNVEIRNYDTDEIISSGGSVPVGTKLILKFLKQENGDIVWYEDASPNTIMLGEWRANAMPPVVSCNEKDYIGRPVETYPRAYIPLVIDPPARNITTSLNMTCGALSGNDSVGYSATCTVNNEGPVSASFNFSSSQGKFYFRGSGGASSCVGNQTALNKGGGFMEEDFKLNVSGGVLYTYNLTATPAVDENRPPEAPTINDKSIAGEGSVSTFNIQATDQDKDKIRYAIDWDINGTIDQWLPSDYVDSGTVEIASFSWELGSHTFRVKTQDEHGALSGWTNHTVTIVAGPDDAFSLVCSFGDIVNINTSYVFHVTAVNNSGDVSYTWSPGGTHGNSLSWPGSDTVGSYSFTVTGVDSSNKSASASCSVTVKDPNSDNPPGDVDEDPKDSAKANCFPPPIDGINLAHGQSWTFFPSRIGNCNGVTAICNGGSLETPDGGVFNKDIYKYKSCIKPKFKEF